MHRHRDVAGGWFRAAVFGVSDGLVSNVSLIIGVVGADTGRSAVVVAGFAGMIAGSVSMAAGEYVSVSAQRELLAGELAIERRSLEKHPAAELDELTRTLVARGVDDEVAADVARELSADPDVALEVHALSELGMGTDAGGSPVRAAASSLLSFCVGALVPLVAWLFAEGTAAVVTSLVMSTVLAAVIGAAIGAFTRRSPSRAAARQVALMLVACGVTALVGSLVGAAVG